MPSYTVSHEASCQVGEYWSLQAKRLLEILVLANLQVVQLANNVTVIR